MAEATNRNHETPVQARARECHEELGVDVEVTRSRIAARLTATWRAARDGEVAEPGASWR